MKIKITPAFTQADIQKDIDAYMDRVNRVTISEINAVGLKFVTEARDKMKSQGGFDDQTGNLRSSIGYIIVYDGQIVREDFNHGGGPIGQKEGKQFAEYQAALNPNGYVLITVAGMEYASFVEAKNYDVITGSTLNANSDMRKVWANVKRAFK